MTTTVTIATGKNPASVTTYGNREVRDAEGNLTGRVWHNSEDFVPAGTRREFAAHAGCSVSVNELAEGATSLIENNAIGACAAQAAENKED